MRRLLSAGRGRVTGRWDAGITVTELLVSMMVLTIFLTVASTSVLTLSRSTRRHADTVRVQSSIRQAFLLLDKQIRYADAVTTPGTAGGAQWIEWRLTQGGTSRCYQWRATAATGRLEYRSWVVPAGGGSVGAPAWVNVATDLSIGALPVFTTSSAGLAAAPFSLPASVVTYGLPHARVGVALTSARAGAATGASSASTSTVFTALNAEAAGAAVCSEVART